MFAFPFDVVAIRFRAPLAGFPQPKSRSVKSSRHQLSGHYTKNRHCRACLREVLQLHHDHFGLLVSRSPIGFGRFGTFGIFFFKKPLRIARRFYQNVGRKSGMNANPRFRRASRRRIKTTVSSLIIHSLSADVVSRCPGWPPILIVMRGRRLIAELRRHRLVANVPFASTTTSFALAAAAFAFAATTLLNFNASRTIYFQKTGLVWKRRDERQPTFPPRLAATKKNDSFFIDNPFTQHMAMAESPESPRLPEAVGSAA